jgi:hypothetical protein
LKQLFITPLNPGGAPPTIWFYPVQRVGAELAALPGGSLSQA